MPKAETLLDQKSIRITPMRQLVLEYFLAENQIVGLTELEEIFPRADRITLYRTLKTFEEKGILHRIDNGVSEVKYALELFIVVMYSFGGNSYQYLLPFWYLEDPYARLVGWVSLHGSLVWIFIAQLQMANSWRIGIDYEHKTELVTSGLFSVSRNPIFLEVLLANLGVFLVIPNAFTLLVNVWSFSVIHTQVRLEEAFLAQMHVEVYQQYSAKVRRWI